MAVKQMIIPTTMAVGMHERSLPEDKKSRAADE